MLGAIVGDVIGSIYEWNNIKTTDFDIYQVDCHFTDDSLLTVAVADALLNDKDFTSTIQFYGRLYPNAGFGGRFKDWLQMSNPEPYNSWGNGSAMRVSPVGWLFDTEEEVLTYARKSAEVTHNHPDGIAGAQAVALAIFLARMGKNKAEIKAAITSKFSYNLDEEIKYIRPFYKFDVSCAGSVPESIIAFLESDDVESAIRLAISIGGDSDTIASIAGAITEAYYGVIPVELKNFCLKRLPKVLLSVVEQFEKVRASKS